MMVVQRSSIEPRVRHQFNDHGQAEGPRKAHDVPFSWIPVFVLAVG